MRKNWWSLDWQDTLKIITVFLIFPFILNGVLFSWRAPWTNGAGNDWLGFWGNYSGAFVGALVALWIARKQINDQRKLESEKRVLAQLPALVFLKYEMERMLKELEQALEDRNGYAKYDGKTGEKFTNLTEDEKRANKYRAEDKIYNVKPTNTEGYTYITNIESIDLHVALIECFNFHKQFSETVSQSHSAKLAEIEYQKQLDRHHESPTEESAILFKQKFFRRFEVQAIKRDVWKRLEEEKQIDRFKDTYEELIRELDKIKKVKANIS
ncbi:hypothetical protein AB0764_10510 [Priestia megaterium]|uniref:hypothetical protein n=1 Tax=Priestia megaterium TaxID=1404 RepID=UPI0038780EAD